MREGEYRFVSQRLVTHAEEGAFYDGIRSVSQSVWYGGVVWGFVYGGLVWYVVGGRVYTVSIGRRLEGLV